MNEHERKAHERRKARMDTIDALPRDVREIVYEEGWTIVNAFWVCGVRKAKHIRHLIDTVRSGPGAYGNATTSAGSFDVRNGQRVARGHRE